MERKTQLELLMGDVLNKFHWLDYLVCVISLTICVIIGVYFGFFRVSTSLHQYLVGDRKLKTLPVSLSLVASFFSGIAFLGIPLETFYLGIKNSYLLIGHVMMTLVMSYVFLPVFYRLNLTSLYAYLERRYNKNVRVFGSLLFTINMIAWLSVVMYLPGLIFYQGNGVKISYTVLVIGAISIFYTSMGGIKAVIWTNIVQTIIILTTLLVVAIKGTLNVGDINTILERNIQYGRFETPNLNLDFSTTYTLWASSIGGCFYFLHTAAINQNMIQRYISLPSLKSAKIAAFIFSFGFCLLTVLCIYYGLLMYATLVPCDSLKKKQVWKVMEEFWVYPGLMGTFVAGIISASLSSFSTGLNAMTAVVIEDFYPYFSTKQLTEKDCSLLMKLTVIIFGIICIWIVYVIPNLQTALQINATIGFIVGGASVGIFTMGVLLPWVNAKGAFIGGISSLIFMTCLCFNSPSASFTHEKYLNGTVCQKTKLEPETISHVSDSWYTFLGTFVTIIVGLLASFIQQPSDPRDVDPRLLAPFLQKIIKPREFPNEPDDGIIYAYSTNKMTTSPQTVGQPVPLS